LKEDHRYLVAIRDLTRTDGTEVLPSDYFLALRDQIDTEVAELEARREHFEDIFTTLAASGVERESLILAWDFRTSSGEAAWGDVLHVREDAFERFEAGTDGVGTCTVEDVAEDVNDEVFRRVRGTYTVPLYMETQYEGSLANRDADGNMAYNGTAEAPFELIIPRSVVARVEGGEGPARMLMYGHGLLGSARQVSSGGTRRAAQYAEMVAFGTDYWGLAEPDEAQFLNSVVTQFDNFDQLGERLIQGTINSLLLQKAFAGPCAELEALTIDVDGTPTPVADPEAMYYYGISQGGIMGATLAALSDTVDAYVLQVGAVNYSVMVRRSIDFEPFERTFELWYESKLDRDWFIVSTQPMWDLAEPAPYAAHVLGEPLPGVDNSRRRVLYQTSRWDAQVSNVASDMAARSMGLPWFESSVYEPYGVTPTSGPEDSGYVIYHLDDVEPVPSGTNIDVEDNSAHNDLRFLDPMLEQLDRFCQPDGQVFDTCPGNDCEIVNTRAR